MHIDLSPDGRLLAVAVLEDEVPRIRIHAVDRPGGQRLASGGSWDPVWSPDGEWLYFVTTLGGVNLHLSRLPLREDSEPQVLVAEDALNWYPSISPDGRYMAFEKWSGTERNVFVLDLETRARWPVSAGQAVGPRWSAGGDEIFYQSPEGIMAVAVRTEPGFSSEMPRLIVPHRGWLLTRTVSPDGERFLLRVADEDSAAESVVDIKVVLNWFEELEARVPINR